MRKAITGLLAIIVGLVVGAYLGIWVMLIGGIVQAIHAIQAVPVDALGIALGIVRVLLSAVVGWLVALVFIGTGLSMIRRSA